MRRVPAVRRSLELVAARELSPTVRELSFRTADGAPLDYLAGQFWKLYLPDGVERDYSAASAPDPARPDHFSIAVTRVDGPGSDYLHRIELGEQVGSLGPNGFFVRDEPHRDLPALYVGTGTGLSPLRAMLEEELARPDGPPQTLLFGCRTEASILWRDELDRWSRGGRLRVEISLSRGAEDWQGRRGWVQAHLRELLPPAPAHVYVCGLSPMVGEVRRVLKEELGVDRRHVHSERYD